MHDVEIRHLSHIHMSLFLPLRVLWKHRPRDEFSKNSNWKMLIDVDKVAQKLKKLDSRKEYLNSFNLTETPSGVFALVSHYRAHASRLPATLVTPRITVVPKDFDYGGEIRRPWTIGDPDYISIPRWERYYFSPANEELPVNIALKSLLTPISIQFSFSMEWTIDRKRLNAGFDKMMYHACTDGYLKGKGGVAMVLLGVRSASEQARKKMLYWYNTVLWWSLGL